MIFNKVGSDHHERAAARGASSRSASPVLGALRRDERVARARAPPRPGAGRRSASRARAPRSPRSPTPPSATSTSTALLALARAAAPLDRAGLEPGAAGAAAGAPIAIAARARRSRSTTRENLELLEAAGAELAPFDPLADEALPPRAPARCVLAGGFPEVFGAELEANARAARRGRRRSPRPARPVLAECGGLLFLCRELDGRADVRRAARAPARMTGRLSARLPRGDGGDRARRGSTPASGSAATSSTTRAVEPARRRAGPRGRSRPAARARPRASSHGGVQASYLHIHWAAHPELARRFVARPRRRRRSRA